MFTGLIDAVGRVEAVERRGGAIEIRIAAPYDDLAPGESVAVNGACLTAIAPRPGVFQVQVVPTTTSRTHLGDLDVGDRVNLERALRVGDRLGGHFVQGHVDGVARVVGRSDEQGQRLLDLRVPPAVRSQVILHGAIAVDGVSLTVNALPKPGVVQISLIPYTLAQTTLGGLKVGDAVQVEADMLGKYVAQAARSVRRATATGRERKGK